MNITRRTALGAFAATFATPLFAKEPPVFATNGIAIQGYDPVAYFTDSKPVEGLTDHTSDWNGSTWKFANAQNKTTFDADPDAYAPQYGGYCAYAVSKGYTATTDPFAWTVHNNKLYLNYSKSVRLLWSTNKDGNIEKGDANWPKVLG